ncbi:hypothetical protein H5410_036209 [Solanum commersonii]|uniref:Uncharacterized protein n=1 Tax=Solanum commersonii TaxID=4109 RepID=A0A9J5Y3I9_SOLCO|nr:hypothetical protein H5410_036209 [Solanum commersonii]
MMPTSGYATPHGYSVLPLEANRPTSSVSRTVTHNPTDSQPSSSSTSQLRMSSLCLQGNGYEPNTPSTNQSATPGQVLTQVGVRDMHNRLAIEPDGYTFNPDDVVGIIYQAIKDSIEMLFRLGARCQAISRHNIFWSSGLLMKARKNNKNPWWILSEDWEKLLAHLENDPRFKQMSEIGKKARSSTKDGSLHTSGAQGQGSVRRKLKNPEDPDVWVEPRAEMTYNRYLQAFEDLRQTQPEENRGMPLTQEHVERVSYDNEWMKKYLAMEQKIAELSNQVEDSRARERRRDLEYAGGIPPCSNDVTFPPRPSQSQPTRYPVYGQQIIMTDESSSDEEDEDHVANTLLH